MKQFGTKRVRLLLACFPVFLSFRTLLHSQSSVILDDLSDSRFVLREMMDQRRAIVVAGHSYVRRLGDYCRKSDAERNLGFDANSFRVSWCGIGGATITRYDGGRAERRFRQMMFGAELRADVIFIHIGENDVLQGVEAAVVVEHIHRLVIALEAANRVIFVGQLLPFPALHSRRHVVLFYFTIKD